MKNKGFNKQGLEKAGIGMNVGNDGVRLALPPNEAQRIAVEQHQKQQQEHQARQELQGLINFRSTCAMNNLGCLLQSYDVSDFQGTCIEDLAHIQENVSLARKYAEALMVELAMIPDTKFFRDLEEAMEQKPEIVTE